MTARMHETDLLALLESLARQGVNTLADVDRLVAQRRAELAALEALADVMREAGRPASRPRQPQPAPASEPAPQPPEEEADVVTRAQRGCQAAQAELLEQLRPAIHSLITKANLPLERDDLAQEARIAVLESLPRYEPARGTPNSFFGPRIRGALLDYARAKGYFLHGGRRTGRVENLASLSTPVYEDNRTVALGDLIADGQDTLERMRQIDDLDEFAALIRPLDQQKRQVLYLRFVQGLSQREIGYVVDLSPSRISQLMTESLTFLRQRQAP